jgi:LacI family transcriptional regulator
LRKRFDEKDVMATIKDVAQRAGVSTSTVSHVVNETRFVSLETRERVLAAMKELGYRPNRLASSLRKNQTHTLGVLLPNSANPYFAEILLGIESACFDHGYNIILGNANDDAERELAYLRVLLARQVDGVLLISSGAYEQSVDLLAAYEIPVVMVDRSANLSIVDEIFTDNYQGGLMATNYLLDLGHRRIACIMGPSFLTPSADRVHGYRDALQARNIPHDDALCIIGDFQLGGGYRACQQLLNLDQPPTAIFACNDLMAVGAMCAIQEHGLHVPDHISVIGYDDIPLASYSVPRLTTIAQPAQKLGQLAVKKLIEQLQQNNGLPKQPSREILPVSLVERSSCKPYDLS